MGCPSVSCGWSCLRFLSCLFFYLSLVGLVVSFTLTAWAYYVQLKIGDHVNLAAPNIGYLWPATLGAAVIFTTPVHLLAIALRASLVKSFSCKRSLRRNTRNGKCLDRLLFLHVILSCLSGFLILGACAGGAFFWSYSWRRVRQGLYKVLRLYPTDETTKVRMDRLQIELQCCGSESYIDWFFVPWQGEVNKEDEFQENNEDYRKGQNDRSILMRERRRQKQHDKMLETINDNRIKFISTDVPYSCCTASILGTCINQGIANNYGPDTRLTISSTGCYAKLLERANDTGRDVVACLLLLSVYQLTLSILSRLLQTARLSILRMNAKGEYFVSWIFGRRPRDDEKSCPCDCPCEAEPLQQQNTASSDSSESCVQSKKNLKHATLSKETNEKSKRKNSVSKRYKDTCREMHEYYKKKRSQENEKNCSTSSSSSEDEEEEEENDENKEECNDRERHSSIELRNLNSKDVCDRFRGNLQDTLERRQNQENSYAHSPVIVIPAAVNKCSISLSSSSSLPPLPPTPHRYRLRKTATQTVEGFCPVHNNHCPVHDVESEREFLLQQVNSCCPVHGNTNYSARR